MQFDPTGGTVQRKGNIAARAGRWSAQHRKTAIFGWLAFVLIAFVAGMSIGTKTLDENESGVGESGRADKTVYESFPKKDGEMVLVQSKSLEASDPAFRATVRDVSERMDRVPHVTDVEKPTISKDGHSALVQFSVRGDSKQVEERIDPVLEAVDAAQKDHAEMRVEVFGGASADKALDESQEKDFQKAEFSSLPLTLLILLIAFGSLVAAGIPVLLAMSGVLGTIGLLGPLSQLMPMDGAASSVILLIGLAVGVDYALFYIRREREERAAGRSEEAALEAAAATSGRAVLISGLTVMIAMGGMYLAGAQTFTSMATGTILVVAVSVIGSITVLPAILSKLGDRVNKGRVPFLGRRKRDAGDSRVWGAVLRPVLKRPLASALVSGALLVALAIPAFGMHTALPGTDTLPRELEVVQTYDRIQAAFPGEAISANVVVKADDVRSAEVTGAIADLREQAQNSDLLLAGGSVEVSPDHTVANVEVPIAGDGTDEKSVAALEELREEVVPATVGQVAEVNVGGMTAGTQDFNDLMKSNVGWVFAFVLAMAFLLLLVTFRSIIVPIKAIVLNLLSVGASYGVLVLVFQNEWAESLLGFESTGAITAWLPLFLFVVLFGLSMDYHVFILSRIREAVDRGMSTEAAVERGIKSTAGVVTSAAFVMVAVFAVFATLSGIDMKQMGVGLAVAVLIDATIIRGVLLPATMKLLGDWNWWLPKGLHWLPRVQHEAAVEPARA
jgi:uncharacterized membrane protein YdfJ with MMPL/SSD domain